MINNQELTNKEKKEIFFDFLKQISCEFSEEILTPEETMKLLKLDSEAAVLSAARDGEIPSFKLRGKVRFFKSEVLESLKAREQKKEKASGTVGVSLLDKYKTTGRRGRKAT